MSEQTATKQTKDAPKREEHKLLRPHKHGGKWHREGAKVQLTPAQVKRLRNRKQPKIA